MPEAETWTPLAQTLGFDSEAEMLRNFYVMQRFSLSQLSSILGYSTWSIRRRLNQFGIPLRGRGGPANRLGRRLLKHLSDDELCKTPAALLAIKCEVHVSTVWAEIRLREREKTSEVLSDNANKGVRAFRVRQRSLDGSGSVSTPQTLSGVLPEEGRARGDGNS